MNRNRVVRFPERGCTAAGPTQTNITRDSTATDRTYSPDCMFGPILLLTCAYLGEPGQRANGAKVGLGGFGQRDRRNEAQGGGEFPVARSHSPPPLSFRPAFYIGFFSALVVGVRFGCGRAGYNRGLHLCCPHPPAAYPVLTLRVLETGRPVPILAVHGFRCIPSG
jgi:hypothetical protein